MLPELKQASVVDAGGKGLLCILEGAIHSIHAKEEIKVSGSLPEESKTGSSIFNAINTNDIKFAYCTEFFINLKQVTDAIENNLKDYLQSVGDSIVVVGDEDIIKVHVHTNHPGNVLEKALKIGTLSNLKIENMKEQHSSMINFVEESAVIVEKPKELKEMGFVAVSMGDGICELFKSLGADIVIEGGQTMNPSTEDILAAVESVPAKNVFVLPNNKNIILAAKQAQELCTDKVIHVVPTKSIPQGINAIINFLALNTIEENMINMTTSMEKIKTGQVTYAVRDTVFNDKEIKEGNLLYILEGKIVHVSENLQLGAKELLSMMIETGNEFVSIYYGADMTEQSANELSDFILEKYPDCEVELQNGEQPLYYYIFSVE
jgi:DAK2 domain fusion protein YloV